jgi:hypothetical protein
MKPRIVVLMVQGLVGVGLLGLASCTDLFPRTTQPGTETAAKRECSSDTACVFDGIPNRSLGAAKLRLAENENKNLIIENIGSSKSDGVRQFGIPQDTVVMSAGLACPNFVESVQGSWMQVVMYGDAPEEVISYLTAENIDGDTLVTEADLSPIGVTRYTVQLFLGDQKIGEVTDLSNSRVILPGRRDYQDMMCGIHPGGLVWVQYQLTFPGPVILDETGDRFEVDTIRIKGQDQGVDPSIQTSFDNFFANVPMVEMTYQAVDNVFED